MNVSELLHEIGAKFLTEGRYCRPGWAQLKCPFCGGGRDPHKPYLGINLAYAYGHCWNCGPHNLVDIVMELSGSSKGRARQMLRGIEIERPKSPTRKVGKLVQPAGLGPLRGPHRRYLQERALDPDWLTTHWNLQGIGVAPRFQWRIYIPLSFRGRVVSWTTRGITDAEPRYITAKPEQEEINHKTLLFGEDYVRHCVIVTEGPFDAMRIGPGAVALLGTQYTRSQVKRLSKYPVRVIVLDNEPAAQKRARDLCDLLEVFPGETYQVTLDSKDAASATDKEIRKLRKQFL